MFAIAEKNLFDILNLYKLKYNLTIIEGLKMRTHKSNKHEREVSMLKKIYLSLSLVILLFFFFGCPKTTENNGNGEENGITDPSFANHIQPTFTGSCALANCHATSSSSAGLSLEAGQAYAELVNVNATQEPGKVRVIPSDAANSYLVIKLEGRQTKGGRMPPAGPLSAENIQKIKNWIDNGAQNN